MRKNTLVAVWLIGMFTFVTVADPGYANHALGLAKSVAFVCNVQPR